MKTYMIYYMSARRKSAKTTVLENWTTTNERIKFSLIKLWTQSTKVRSLELKLWKNDFNLSARIVKYNFLESLILAQDERWRRA